MHERLVSMPEREQPSPARELTPRPLAVSLSVQAWPRESSPAGRPVRPNPRTMAAFYAATPPSAAARAVAAIPAAAAAAAPAAAAAAAPSAAAPAVPAA